MPSFADQIAARRMEIKRQRQKRCRHCGMRGPHSATVCDMNWRQRRDREQLNRFLKVALTVLLLAAVLCVVAATT